MILADKIAQEIMGSEYFQSLFVICMERSYYQILNLCKSIQYKEKEYKDLLRFADLLSASSFSEARSYAYHIITFLNSSYKNEPYYRMVSKSVYYNLGNFPAVNYLTKEDCNEAVLPLDKMIQIDAKKALQEVPNSDGIYFTDTQYDLYSGLSESREFSFSGPTSMGKSFIIKAFISRIIHNRPPENLAVIVPTRALISQFTLEIKKDLGIQLERNKYKVVTNSNISELILENNTEEEKRILRYIANIICIDTLEPKSGYKSPIIEELIKRNKIQILELAKSKNSNIEVPFSLLDSNESIDISIQNTVYKQLFELHVDKKQITLSGNVDYENCQRVLEKFYHLYNWEKTNIKELNNVNSLKYYAFIMNQWINGVSLNQIISDSIKYKESSQSFIRLPSGANEIFSSRKKEHVNILIGEIIRDIEKVIRFHFEKYFNHYFLVLKHILGEDNAGDNWAVLLEYGTRNRIVIALQNLGLSRYTANIVYDKCRAALIVENGKLKGFEKSLILSMLRQNSLEYDEVYELL